LAGLSRRAYIREHLCVGGPRPVDVYGGLGLNELQDGDRYRGLLLLIDNAALLASRDRRRNLDFVRQKCSPNR
jgi:hypothetical protein